MLCDDSDGVTRYLVYKMDDDSFYVKVTGGDVHEERFSSSTSRFDLELGRMADQVNTHSSSIKLYMKDAMEILLVLRKEFEGIQTRAI